MDRQAQVTTHLTRVYRYRGRGGRPGRGLPSVPVAACGHDGGNQVSIYKHPDQEKLVDCPECLAWLAEGDNRLFVTPGGMEQWIRNHARDVHYIDVPAGGDDDETED
jgi:hypothetical protein